MTKIYPKCFNTLNKWLDEITPTSRRNIYNNINPILFDVSLRDGLQGIKKDYVDLNEKKNIYYSILFNHNPQKIEIGSIVNPRFYPMFSETFELFKLINEDKGYKGYKNKGCKNKGYNDELYVVTPTTRQVYSAKKNKVTNYSFITSVSNSFQRNNINKNLEETKEEINRMCSTVRDIPNKNIKLYISCINECPIEKFVNIDFIVNEILYYNEIREINEICLTDTCGSLSYDNYKYIIDKFLYEGETLDKLSLHLHSNNKNIKEIFNYSLNNKINKFDVSLSTFSNNNITYDMFYKLLVDYIEIK